MNKLAITLGITSMFLAWFTGYSGILKISGVIIGMIGIVISSKLQNPDRKYINIAKLLSYIGVVASILMFLYVSLSPSTMDEVFLLT